MMIWIVLAAMLLSAIAILGIPLMFFRREPQASRAVHDVALFRDQLVELERERNEGEIGEQEAVAAKREIERRLLAAGRMLETASIPVQVANRGRRLRLAIVLALIIAPATFLLYLTLGTPQAPAFLTAVAEMRAQDDARRAEMTRLVEQVEQHLAKVPGDGTGWALLASAKLRLGKMDDARNALNKARQLLPPSDAAEATARFGQTLADVSEWQAARPIRQYANEALELDPNNARGHMVLAVLAMQANDADDARKEWSTIIKTLPADSPFVAQAKQALQAIDQATAQQPK
jgi:cytochrome c-type biogenesis protein CcmH